MTDRDLISLGFNKYPPARFKSSNIETCFQKRYDDKYGKKYFITVNKWRAWQHSPTKCDASPTYEYETQLYRREGHEAVDLLFHSDWTLEAVEQYVEKLWQTGLFEYYEVL